MLIQTKQDLQLRNHSSLTRIHSQSLVMGYDWPGWNNNSRGLRRERASLYIEYEERKTISPPVSHELLLSVFRISPKIHVKQGQLLQVKYLDKLPWLPEHIKSLNNKWVTKYVQL